MSRAKKPAPRASDVKSILGRRVRPLTATERRQRTSYFDEFGQDATAVEPAAFARHPR